jgi:hypothetical protein
MFRKAVAIAACLFLVSAGSILAGGISADAGLTPAQDKWIVRTQIRLMQRGGDTSPMQRDMQMYMTPLVVAYGLRPELTLMVRQVFVSRTMTMNGVDTETSGLNDLFVLAKYRAFRKNTRDYTIGLAPSLGVSLPTGVDGIGSKAVNLALGMNGSYRRGTWAVDANLELGIDGITGKEGEYTRGETFSIVTALARQFAMGTGASNALAPVLEISYVNAGPRRLLGTDLPNSGESYMQLSPGLKFTHSSLILETLVQVPVWQDQEGAQTELEVSGLIGVRLMF